PGRVHPHPRPLLVAGVHLGFEFARHVAAPGRDHDRPTTSALIRGPGAGALGCNRGALAGRVDRALPRPARALRPPLPPLTVPRRSLLAAHGVKFVGAARVDGSARSKRPSAHTQRRLADSRLADVRNLRTRACKSLQLVRLPLGTPVAAIWASCE